MRSKRKSPISLTLCIGICTGLGILAVFQDYIQASRVNGAFYLSESTIFNSYWLIFIPGILLLNHVQSSIYPIKPLRLIIGLMVSVVLHLIFYALLIHVISNLFFEHAYSIHHTMKYGVSTLLISSSLVYGIVSLILAKRIPPEKSYPVNLSIKTGNTFKNLPVNEIIYLKAESPYVAIITDSKKYLHSESLKQMSHQLDPKIFMQIHKSSIVNLKHIDSYVSRNNGDYDIKMTNADTLRLSRNYAAEFKAAMHSSGQPTNHSG